jgi:hypothetical protein
MAKKSLPVENRLDAGVLRGDGTRAKVHLASTEWNGSDAQDRLGVLRYRHEITQTKKWPLGRWGTNPAYMAPAEQPFVICEVLCIQCSGCRKCAFLGIIAR